MSKFWQECVYFQSQWLSAAGLSPSRGFVVSIYKVPRVHNTYVVVLFLYKWPATFGVITDATVKYSILWNGLGFNRGACDDARPSGATVRAKRAPGSSRIYGNTPSVVRFFANGKYNVNNWRTPQNFTIYSCTIHSAMFARTYKYTLLVNGQSSKCFITRQRYSPMNHFYFKDNFSSNDPNMSNVWRRTKLVRILSPLFSGSHKTG